MIGLGGLVRLEVYRRVIRAIGDRREGGCPRIIWAVVSASRSGRRGEAGVAGVGAVVSATAPIVIRNSELEVVTIFEIVVGCVGITFAARGGVVRGMEVGRVGRIVKGENVTHGNGGSTRATAGYARRTLNTWNGRSRSGGGRGRGCACRSRCNCCKFLFL